MHSPPRKTLNQNLHSERNMLSTRFAYIINAIRTGNYVSNTNITFLQNYYQN